MVATLNIKGKQIVFSKDEIEELQGQIDSAMSEFVSEQRQEIIRAIRRKVIDFRESKTLMGYLAKRNESHPDPALRPTEDLQAKAEGK